MVDRAHIAIGLVKKRKGLRISNQLEMCTVEVCSHVNKYFPRPDSVLIHTRLVLIRTTGLVFARFNTDLVGPMARLQSVLLAVLFPIQEQTCPHKPDRTLSLYQCTLCGGTIADMIRSGKSQLLSVWLM